VNGNAIRGFPRVEAGKRGSYVLTEHESAAWNRIAGRSIIMVR